MVVIHKDIFFANIPDVDHGECHLDLYLPDKPQNRTQNVSDENFTLENIGDNEKELKGSFSKAKQKPLKHIVSCGDKTDERLEFQGTRKKRKRESAGVPFVLFIHGGGWRRGGRSSWKHFLYFDVNFLVAFLQYFIGTYGNIGEKLAENNIACAVVSYPLTEAGPVILLAEMLLSYTQSVFFVFLICCPVLGLLLFSLAHNNHGVPNDPIFKEKDTASLFRAFTFLSLFITNFITSVLFCVRRRHYNISVSQIRWFSVALIASVIAASYSNKPEYVLLVLTLVVNQSVIFYQRFKRHGSTYEQQTKAVAQAVRWAKSFSQDTGHTDVNRVYLMGHSAGGHLVTLSTLDESILASVACSSSDIKGVISISGVYDLFCLNKHLLRPVYLEPSFGRSSAKWFEASPEHVVKKTRDARAMPRFLLMLAEKDLFLKSQSFKFAETLDQLQYDCQHVEICKTNHFNIVTNTSTSRGSTLSFVLDFVK